MNGPGARMAVLCLFIRAVIDPPARPLADERMV